MALALYASILPRGEGALNTNYPSWVGGPLDVTNHLSLIRYSEGVTCWRRQAGPGPNVKNFVEEDLLDGPPALRNISGRIG